MNVILFGATGMVGQGILRECLLDPDVQQILSIERAPSGQHHAKLHELAHTNFFDYSDIEPQLTGFDACFFSLGVSSAGMDEARYTHLTTHPRIERHSKPLVFILTREPIAYCKIACLSFRIFLSSFQCLSSAVLPLAPPSFYR